MQDEIGFAFPNIDPTAISLGPLSIQWYGLAYLTSLILGIIYIKYLIKNDGLWQGKSKMTSSLVDDLGFYTFLGIFFGGRLGFILFYNLEHYIANPTKILRIWEGGMSIHGGILFSALILLVFSHYKKIYYRHIFDVVTAALPIGLLLGRIANFINGELYGHVTNVAWAVRFPTGGGLPRHPSQLYEAVLEGLVAFIILAILIWKFKALKRPGLITGVFGIVYGVSRIFVEFYRVPDAQIGYYFDFVTQGMLLSIPMVLLGIYFVVTSKTAMKKN